VSEESTQNVSDLLSGQKRCIGPFTKQANVKQSVLSNTLQDINYGILTFN